MADLELADLADAAGIEGGGGGGGGGDRGGSDSGGMDESTTEFLTETLKTLEKRGLIEPILFGADGAQELQKQQQTGQQNTTDDGDDDNMRQIALNAETVKIVGNGITSKMGDDVTLDELLAEIEGGVQAVKQQLGPDATVQDLVDIAENNPQLINERLETLKEEL